MERHLDFFSSYAGIPSGYSYSFVAPVTPLISYCFLHGIIASIFFNLYSF